MVGFGLRDITKPFSQPFRPLSIGNPYRGIIRAVVLNWRLSRSLDVLDAGTGYRLGATQTARPEGIWLAAAEGFVGKRRFANACQVCIAAHWTNWQVQMIVKAGGNARWAVFSSIRHGPPAFRSLQVRRRE